MEVALLSVSKERLPEFLGSLADPEAPRAFRAPLAALTGEVPPRRSSSQEKIE